MHAARGRPANATFSEGDWSRVIFTLQGNYSLTLYGHEGRVDADALSLIWLPLISNKTLDFLMCMGICAWEPVPARKGRQPLPLHAPFSSVAPGAAVWRYYMTPASAVPSHGWIEVAHASRLDKKPRIEHGDAVPWFYVARGSGVSLNVGRTVAVTHFPNCTKPDPRKNPEVYRMMGVDLSQLDSVYSCSTSATRPTHRPGSHAVFVTRLCCWGPTCSTSPTLFSMRPLPRNCHRPPQNTEGHQPSCADVFHTCSRARANIRRSNLCRAALMFARTSSGAGSFGNATSKLAS